jgi:hypothetical protein
LGKLLEMRGHKVVWTTRDVVPEPGTDLTIQTCFAPSVALVHAIENKIPFLIMEAPYFRSFYDQNAAGAWGYNGLAGGSWRTPPPEEKRPHPELQPMKTEGRILIVGQKPTDLSLRGSDHIQWILDRFEEFPDSDFRPHPHMVWPKNLLPPIEEVLEGYQTVITYNSTVGVDARIAGCEVRVDGPCSLAEPDRDRKEWIHDLSWAQGLYSEYDALVDNILDGYDEAKGRMESGQHELATIRARGPAIQQRYYSLIDHSDWGGPPWEGEKGEGRPKYDQRGVQEDSD